MPGNFIFPHSLNDQVYYPDVPADGTAARQQFMDLFNEIKDNMNNNLAQQTDLAAKANQTDLAAHLAENTQHITAEERVAWNGKQDASAELAKYKKGSSTFTDNDTAQTFADAFCTDDSLVVISITSVTPPQGSWSVESASGSFTITSTVAESADITFDYFITKAV